MKQPRLFYAAAAILALWLWGCSETDAPLTVPLPDVGSPVAQYLDEPCGDPLVLSFVSGPRLDLGYVMVANDPGVLCVTIDITESPWLLSESQVVIRGPGGRMVRPPTAHLKDKRSVFQVQHDPPTNLWDFRLDLAEHGFGPGDELRMAVRSQVELEGGNERARKQRRAWAIDLDQPHTAGEPFFTYTVQACEEPVPCMLTVEQPAAGDFLCAGWYTEIVWTSDLCGAAVRIDLLLEGHPCTTIAEETANDGSFTWLAAPCSWQTEGYAIRITDLESGASDDCDGPFSINECWE